MSKLIDSTVRTVRRIAAGLRPVMPDDRGPGPAIECVAVDFTGRYDIDVRRHIIRNGNTAFSGVAVSTRLRSVLKTPSRADARLVALALEAPGQHRVLRIADNGRGAREDSGGDAPQSDRHDKSFGLPGIRVRTPMLNDTSRSIPPLKTASPFPSRSSLTPSHPKRPLHDQSDHRRRPHARA